MAGANDVWEGGEGVGVGGRGGEKIKSKREYMKKLWRVSVTQLLKAKIRGLAKTLYFRPDMFDTLTNIPPLCFIVIL